MQSALRVLVLGKHREETQCSSDSCKTHFWFSFKQETKIITDKERGERSGGGAGNARGRWNKDDIFPAVGFDLKDMTNLWEKEFLERLRKERSAQHPLSRAPNSCMKHRQDTVNLGWRRRRERKYPSCTHWVNWAVCAWQIQVDQAVGLRQEEVQVLKTKRRVILGWESGRRENGAACVFCFQMLSDRGVLSREDPRVLAQVQVQEGVGVLIAGAQSLRERHHTWERERDKGVRWGGVKKKRKSERRDKGSKILNRERTLSKHFVLLHYSYISRSSISGCYGETVKFNAIFKFSAGYTERWDGSRMQAAVRAAQDIMSQCGVEET